MNTQARVGFPRRRFRRNRPSLAAYSLWLTWGEALAVR